MGKFPALGERSVVRAWRAVCDPQPEHWMIPGRDLPAAEAFASRLDNSPYSEARRSTLECVDRSQRRRLNPLEGHTRLTRWMHACRPAVLPRRLRTELTGIREDLEALFEGSTIRNVNPNTDDSPIVFLGAARL